ncbi:MAG: hypothetical protein EHM67_12840 [Hyphomicrobiaceae bacterium]|nr:MAG: hypothetical protein EHM67_12840 [Hyphomicrobiaceae bacterium]
MNTNGKNEIATSRPTATALAPDMATRLYQGIVESRSTTIIAGGKPFLRLLRDGQWVYGQGDKEVQEGSSWVVNPLSLAHGYCCWSNHEGNVKNEKLGESMVPIYETKPAKPAPIDTWAYTEQRSVELKCLDGEDAGTEVLYSTNSVGGLRAIDSLLAELQAQLQADPSHPCPVLQLECDSYPHSKYGKIYTPVLKNVGWASMDGKLAGEAAPTVAAPKAPVAPVAPEPTARRRPGRPAVAK